jgi:hypothetical protein
MTALHLDAEWLRQKYEVEGLSTYEIARLVQRDPKRVYEKLRDFGIPTRPRGLNLRHGGRDNYILNGGVPTFLGRSHSAETRRKLSVAASRPKPWIRGQRNGMAGRTGSSNPNYKDGSSPERQRLYASGEGRALIRAVYARDGYRCTSCGAGKTGPRSLHAHHVKPWAEYPELRFEIENLVTLCRDCHHAAHRKTA